MSLGELKHPVPLSFEPIKSFFKGLMEAMQRTLQTPLDVRLKESESPRGQLWVLDSQVPCHPETAARVATLNRVSHSHRPLSGQAGAPGPCAQPPLPTCDITSYPS